MSLNVFFCFLLDFGISFSFRHGFGWRKSRKSFGKSSCSAFLWLAELWSTGSIADELANINLTATSWLYIVRQLISRTHVNGLGHLIDSFHNLLGRASQRRGLVVCFVIWDEYALVRVIRIIHFLITLFEKHLLPMGAAALWSQGAHLLVCVKPRVDRSSQDDGLELPILLSITAGVGVGVPNVSIRIGRRPRIPTIRH